MRIEKLELNKIKVTVYPIDLSDMNLNIKALKPDSPQLHTFLYKIMEKVKKETGFNPYQGQIVVEASPMGDCVELTVTKINKTTDNKKNIPKKVHAVLKSKKKNNYIYVFDSFDDMCSALIHISECTLLSSHLYKIENNYILASSGINKNEHIILKEFINDFDNGKFSIDFLSEHGTLVAEKTNLVSLVKGISELNK